jgi:hypothetical protein
MKIEAGKYYRTRGGQVTGPIEKSLTNSIFMHYNEDGTFRYGPTRFDLISEVYVSDTPPADAPRNAAATLRSLAAERDALQAENARLREALKEYDDAYEDWFQFAAGGKDDPNEETKACVRLVKAQKVARAALGET